MALLNWIMKPAIDLDFALIINPGYTEDDLPFGLRNSFEEA
jgi:hypothetical protein